MRIVLTKPHTDAGVQYSPGDTLDLEQDQAEWLIGLGVARAANDAQSASKPNRKGD